MIRRTSQSCLTEDGYEISRWWNNNMAEKIKMARKSRERENQNGGENQDGGVSYYVY